VISKIQYFSESQDALKSNAVKCRYGRHAGHQQAFLSFGAYWVNFSVFPKNIKVLQLLLLSLLTYPHFYSSCVTEKSIPIGGRLDFCFGWKSLGGHLVSRSRESRRLTDTFVFFCSWWLLSCLLALV
jgi:hypothetical protein